MTQKTRRKTLKGLAITVPTVWSAPIIQSITLPAHAGMTVEEVPEEPVACSAPANCYVGLVTADGQFSVMWPGGSGSNASVEYWEGPNCDGDTDGAGPMAIASSADEAKLLLGCDLVLELAETGGGCSIWECCSNCVDAV
jgi:hypothetical protein